MADEDAPVPPHVPFHVAVRVPPPACATLGLPPRLTEGTESAEGEPDEDDPTLVHRVDGRPASTTTWHAVVPDATTVSDALGRDLPCVRRQYELRIVPSGPRATRETVEPRLIESNATCRLELADWRRGDAMPPVLAVEAGCNAGKSYAVHRELIRPKLLEDPTLPMLHLSVRITHADDLYQTCLEHYTARDQPKGGQPIEGLQLACYREGEGSAKARCASAHQLVISPQSVARGLLGDDLGRFADGVLVLDEGMSLALSVGGDKTDATIDDHDYLATVLRKLVDIMPHVVVMDRDLTLTPIVAKMLAVIAPNRNVVHVQFERAAQSNAFCYTFNTQCASQPKPHCLYPPYTIGSDADAAPLSPTAVCRTEAGAGRGKELALDRLELQMLECLRTFDRFPDTPTTAFLVFDDQFQVNPAQLEGKVVGGVTIARVERGEWFQHPYGYQLRAPARVVVTADRPALDTFVAHLRSASDAAPVQLQVDDEVQPYVEVTAPAEPVADAWDYEAKPEGPPERRRLWIACATKSFGEAVLVPLCKRVGATYRFYHAGVGIKSVEGTSAKEDIKATSKAWRHVHVIISTTTIQVAINVKLPFFARWLFASHHSDSLASELMQLVSRVPRGEDAERKARLEDHRIFTLFGSCAVTSCGPPTEVDLADARVDDEQRIEVNMKLSMEAGAASHAEQAHAKRARLDLHGESSADRTPAVNEPLNALKGSVKLYRKLNDGKQHVARFFELAAKCGDARPRALVQLRTALDSMEVEGDDRYVLLAMRDAAAAMDETAFAASDALVGEELVARWASRSELKSFGADATTSVLRKLERHEEMAPLAKAETARLEAARQARRQVEERREDEAMALLDDATREKEAVDTPSNAGLRYDLVAGYLQGLAVVEAMNDEAADDEEDTAAAAAARETAALVRVRRESFWTECERLLQETRDDDRTAFQKLMLDVYFTIEPFLFGDDAAVDALEYISQIPHEPGFLGPFSDAGNAFKQIGKLKTGAVRLARLRTLSLEQLRAETQLRIARKEDVEGKRVHVESVDLESERAMHVHKLFTMLDVPEHHEGAPLAWLTHDASLCADDATPRWVDAHRRLKDYNKAKTGPEQLEYPAADAAHQEGDVKLREALLKLAARVAGSPVPQPNKQPRSIANALKHALKAIGLELVTGTTRPRAGAGANRPVQVASWGIKESSLWISGKKARAHWIRFSLADAVEIRARGVVRARAGGFALADAGDAHERAADFSDEEEAESEGELDLSSAHSAAVQRWKDAGRPAETRPEAPKMLERYEVLRPFNPTSPRREGFDAAALDALRAELSRDALERNAALARVKEAFGHAERETLMASLDMDTQLEALDEALSPPERFGRRWLEVEYEPNSLGRRRALSATVETRTLTICTDAKRDP